MWYSLTLLPRKLSKLEEMPDGRFVAKCPRCGLNVSLRDEFCNVCDQEFSFWAFAQLTWNQTMLSLSRINSDTKSGSQYATWTFAIFVTATVIIPHLLFTWANLPAIVLGLFFSAPVTSVEMALVYWAVPGRANAALKRTYAATKLGHFFLGVTVLLVQWAAITLFPVPAGSFLAVLLTVWVASWVFFNFILPQGRAYSRLLDEADGSRPRPLDPTAPQGRSATED